MEYVSKGEYDSYRQNRESNHSNMKEEERHHLLVVMPNYQATEEIIIWLTI